MIFAQHSKRPLTLAVTSLLVASLTTSLVGCQQSAESEGYEPDSTETNNMAADSTDHGSTDAESFEPNLDETDLEQVALISSVEAKQIDLQRDLINHNWTLLSAVDSKNKPVTALTAIKDNVKLTFHKDDSQQTIGFSVGCNAMGGNFVIEDGVLFVDQVAGDAQACGDLNKAEQLLVQAVTGSSQLSLSPSKPLILTQITEADKTFIWQGLETSESQSLQSPDIVYWEIHGTEQPCPDGTTRSCLKVRPIKYNRDGVKIDEGKWALFAGEIEGYNHEPDQSKIVRLKRFEVAPEVSQAQAYTYVLDSVIENKVND